MEEIVEMLLVEIADVVDINSRRKSQPEPEPVDFTDTHGRFGVEPTENELQELEVFYTRALESFRGAKSKLAQARWIWGQNIKRYEDASDEEDFKTQDAAYNELVRAIGIIGGDVSAFVD